MDQATTARTNRELRLRVGRGWRQLRRGASTIRLRELFYGSGDDSLDLALADALAIISQQGPMRMGALAEALNITPASTTRAVSCLVDKGFAQRVKAPDDHRSVMVSATAAGQVRAEQISERIQAGLDEILSEFSPTELEELAQYFERFVASLDRFVAAQHGP